MFAILYINTRKYILLVRFVVPLIAAEASIEYAFTRRFSKEKTNGGEHLFECIVSGTTPEHNGTECGSSPAESNVRLVAERNLQRIAHFHASWLFFRTRFHTCVNPNGQGPVHALLSLARFRVSEKFSVAAVLQVGGDGASARSDTAKLWFTLITSDSMARRADHLESSYGSRSELRFLQCALQFSPGFFQSVNITNNYANGVHWASFTRYRGEFLGIQVSNSFFSFFLFSSFFFSEVETLNDNVSL